MKTVDLTAQQTRAVDMALDSLRARRSLFRIGGYAGVGKTTLAKAIIEDEPGGAVCAFTGKAGSVLRSKGLKDATTIHKRIYRYDQISETFVLKSKKELSDVSYFLLDEASMVNNIQWRDMQSFGKPIIAIGDPGQLEPVGDDPRLMEDADIVLTEIHRQDADSAIIQFATHVRMGNPIKRGTKGEVQIGSNDLFLDSLEWADVLLCGFNRTRVSVNDKMRDNIFGKDARHHRLIEGDKIVCLKNSEKLGINNGEVFTVDAVYRLEHDGWFVDLRNYDDECLYGIKVSPDSFGDPKPDQTKWKDPKIMRADYGYCLSVHKFQGSEADKVAVISEQCQMWCPIRHAYTAITRAAKELRYSI